MATLGPWIAGIDFPFGQARRFIEGIGWPLSRSEYVHCTGQFGRAGFRAALEGYKKDRIAGDKEHRRATDEAAGSISPQKLYGVPVGLMFFEGARRLLASGVTIPHPHEGNSEPHCCGGLSRRSRPQIHRPPLQERYTEAVSCLPRTRPLETAISPPRPLVSLPSPPDGFRSSGTTCASS